MFSEFRAVSSHCEGQPPYSALFEFSLAEVLRAVSDACPPTRWLHREWMGRLLQGGIALSRSDGRWRERVFALDLDQFVRCGRARDEPPLHRAAAADDPGQVKAGAGVVVDARSPSSRAGTWRPRCRLPGRRPAPCPGRVYLARRAGNRGNPVSRLAGTVLSGGHGRRTELPGRRSNNYSSRLR
jgi:hypothetical protein